MDVPNLIWTGNREIWVFPIRYYKNFTFGFGCSQILLQLMQGYKKPQDLPPNDFVFNLWHMCRVTAYVRGRKMRLELFL